MSVSGKARCLFTPTTTMPSPVRSSRNADHFLLSLSISGKMTGVLALYSAVFMRYSLAVTPARTTCSSAATLSIAVLS